MMRAWLAALILTVACHGLAYGQGFLDSILGPSGFGVWGQGQFDQQTTQQYNNPQFYRGEMNPEQGQFPQGPPPQEQAQYGGQGAQGYYPPQAPPQVQYYSNQQAGDEGQGAQQPMMQGPPQGYQAQQAPPPQGYQGPPQGYQAQQAPPPVRYAPQQPQRAQGPPPAQAQPPLRPGQYSPQQGPPPSPDVDKLPPGSVSITTITPDGTTVQYYPPADEVPPAVQQPIRRAAPQRPKKPAAATARAKPTSEQTQAGARSDETGGVAMPKPVQVPSGDPRSGWDHAVNRAPRAPEVR